MKTVMLWILFVAMAAVLGTVTGLPLVAGIALLVGPAAAFAIVAAMSGVGALVLGLHLFRAVSGRWPWVPLK